jgi:hypothetical protein
LLEQFVAADAVAGLTDRRNRKSNRSPGSAGTRFACGGGGEVHEPSGRFVGAEQGLHALAQAVIARAGFLWKAARRSGGNSMTASKMSPADFLDWLMSSGLKEAVMN